MRTVLTLVKQRPPSAGDDAAPSGEYRIGELLGRGGMADVFAAQRCVDGRQVAIKILHSHLSDLHERLTLEAEVLARLPVGCAPALISHGPSTVGESCLVMERLYGQDLHRRLNRRPALPTCQALAILTRVAQVLDAAHELGVIHRDLKPSNVFLCDAPDQALDVRVLDFGIAMVAEHGSGPPSGESDFVGSPGYLAPEQVAENGLSIGPRTDVFGLAALAYRLFTGLPMFKCRSNAEAAF